MAAKMETAVVKYTDFMFILAKYVVTSSDKGIVLKSNVSFISTRNCLLCFTSCRKTQSGLFPRRTVMEIQNKWSIVPLMKAFMLYRLATNYALTTHSG